MVPNPQDALPLSSLDYESTKREGPEVRDVAAQEHGFDDWTQLERHLRDLEDPKSATSAFERAVEAVIHGELEALRQMLAKSPELIRAQSTRGHRATLLHYVSANGIEGFRQKSPANSADITRLLLDSGAEVDATIFVYRHEHATLALTATSTPPREAGVQIPVLDVLLEYGAAIDYPEEDRNVIRDCFFNGCPEAAEFLARRGARLSLEAAAGIGRLDEVKRLLPAHRNDLQRAFLLACGFGQDEVVEYLLEHGADLRDDAGTKEAPLHWAVMGSQVSTAKLLIERGAPLEQLNGYNGTPLGQALWSFVFGSRTVDYVPVAETLLEAGAQIEPGTLAWLDKQTRRSAHEKEQIAAMLRRYGAGS